MIGRQGMDFREYMRLSTHDRWHLHKSVQTYLEALYGGGAGQMTPDE